MSGNNDDDNAVVVANDNCWWTLRTRPPEGAAVVVGQCRRGRKRFARGLCEGDGMTPIQSPTGASFCPLPLPLPLPISRCCLCWGGCFLAPHPPLPRSGHLWESVGRFQSGGENSEDHEGSHTPPLLTRRPAFTGVVHQNTILCAAYPLFVLI